MSEAAGPPMRVQVRPVRRRTSVSLAVPVCEDAHGEDRDGRAVFVGDYWGGVVDRASSRCSPCASSAPTPGSSSEAAPGSSTHVLRPGVSRHLAPAEYVLADQAVGELRRTAALADVVLADDSGLSVKRIFQRERFDLIHVHGPSLRRSASPRSRSGRGELRDVHASGDLGWPPVRPVYLGFLMDRIDRRIARTVRLDQARARPRAGCPASTRSCRTASSSRRTRTPANRENPSSSSAGTSRARECRCCSAWPEIHRRTGARLRSTKVRVSRRASWSGCSRVLPGRQRRSSSSRHHRVGLAIVPASSRR